MRRSKQYVWDKGQMELLLLLVIIIAFSFFVVGGIIPRKGTIKQQTTPTSQCCDTGDGDQCRTIPEKAFDWERERYELIKSDVIFTEGTAHLEPADENGLQGTTGPNPVAELNNKRVFINTTDQLNIHPECGLGKDLIWKGGACFGIDNDLIIYVCKSDCRSSVGNGEFDAYMRVSRGEEIPDAIKNCVKNNSLIVTDPNAGESVDRLVCPTGAVPEQTLQIAECRVLLKPTGTVSWLSPYCKPAIYLYPEEETEVNVKVLPQGKMTLTIPAYPDNGWNVIAYPNGTIVDQLNSYDYLYYEAEIPDELIAKPEEGFVVAYDKLEKLFNTILPKLGLNEKESSQFKEYWLKALPSSPYYFVGIVPTHNLDSIAPILINPTPESVIRLTLYFEALEKPIAIPKPNISGFTQNQRDSGFTVVEWGGIVKTDPMHTFSCLM